MSKKRPNKNESSRKKDSKPKDPLKVKVVGSSKDWAAIIIPSFAVIVAVIAVCISNRTASLMKKEAAANRIYTLETIRIMRDEAEENRTHNRLSVKPIITFEQISAFEGKQGIYMINAGLGAARIKSIAMIHTNDITLSKPTYGDEKNIESWYIEGIRGSDWVFFKDRQNMLNFLGKLLMRIPSVEQLREKSESEYKLLAETIRKISSSKPELIPFHSLTMRNMVFPAGESKPIVEVDNEVLEKFVEELNSHIEDEKHYFKANIIKKELGETLSDITINVEYEDLYEIAMKPAVRFGSSFEEKRIENNKDK